MITSSQQLSRTPATRTRARGPVSKNYRRDHGHGATQALKSWQIIKIKTLEKKVFDYLLRNEALDLAPGQSKSAAFTQWTHEQQRLIFADGRESIKEAMQRDWRTIMAHFLAYLPAETVRAYELAERSGPKDEARTQALWYLDKELAYQKRHRGYADELARDKFGKGLQHITPEQIFKGVLATLRHRRQTTIEADAAQDAAVGPLPAEATN